MDGTQESQADSGSHCEGDSSYPLGSLHLTPAAIPSVLAVGGEGGSDSASGRSTIRRAEGAAALMGARRQPLPEDGRSQ